jgi:hypothetical protein
MSARGLVPSLAFWVAIRSSVSAARYALDFDGIAEEVLGDFLERQDEIGRVVITGPSPVKRDQIAALVRGVILPKPGVGAGKLNG